jgi:hypothetical protein
MSRSYTSSPPSGIFPSGFLTKILYEFQISYARYMLRPSHPWFGQANNIWWKVQIVKPLTVQIYPASCHFIPHRSKHSLNNQVLKRFQSLIHP